jgi:predicted metalloendopeptidase
LELLQAFFPKANIRENTLVQVAFEKYFEDISNIISTTDNIALNNYMMLRLVSTYSPYLSRAFRVINNEFYRTMNGVDEGALLNIMSEERWEFCIGLTSKYFDQAMGSMFVKYRIQNQPEIKEVAQKVVDAVIGTALSSLDSVEWLSEPVTKLRAKEKLRALVAIVAYPDYVLAPEKLRNYYTDFDVQGNFFTNIENGIYFNRKKMESRLKSPNSPATSWSLPPHAIQAKYSYAGNHLYVASGLLQHPLFDPTLPLAMKFGAFGFRVAAKIMQTLDMKGIHYNNFGELKTQYDEGWISEDTAMAYNQSMYCLMDEIGASAAALHAVSINPELTQRQTFADVGALKYAFKAYKNEAGKHGEENILPGLGQSNDKLFFVSMAQSMCEAVRPGYAATYNGIKTTLPPELRLKTILRQIPQFAETFSCGPSSEVCSLW